MWIRTIVLYQLLPFIVSLPESLFLLLLNPTPSFPSPLSAMSTTALPLFFSYIHRLLTSLALPPLPVSFSFPFYSSDHLFLILSLRLTHYYPPSNSFFSFPYASPDSHRPPSLHPVKISHYPMSLSVIFLICLHTCYSASYFFHDSS